MTNENKGNYEIMEDGTVEFENGDFLSSVECIECDLDNACNHCPYSITSK